MAPTLVCQCAEKFPRSELLDSQALPRSSKTARRAQRMRPNKRFLAKNSELEDARLRVVFQLIGEADAAQEVQTPSTEFSIWASPVRFAQTLRATPGQILQDAGQHVPEGAWYM